MTCEYHQQRSRHTNAAKMKKSEISMELTKESVPGEPDHWWEEEPDSVYWQVKVTVAPLLRMEEGALVMDAASEIIGDGYSRCYVLRNCINRMFVSYLHH